MIRWQILLSNACRSVQSSSHTASYHVHKAYERVSLPKAFKIELNAAMQSSLILVVLNEPGWSELDGGIRSDLTPAAHTCTCIEVGMQSLSLPNIDHDEIRKID